MPKFSSIFKGILKGADFGAKAGIPVLAQIDAVADAVKGIKGKRVADDEAIETVIRSIEELRTAVPEVVRQPKALLESNRVKMSLIGLLVTVLAGWGLDAAAAEMIANTVLYIVSVYVFGDTVRPSVKNTLTK